MINFTNRQIHLAPVLVALLGAGLYGCTEKQGYSVLAVTGTVIGVEVSQNPATQSPQAKLGYNRGELAFVPTNRNGGNSAGDLHNGASDSADVLMELRYGGIFDLGASSGIYQRLAVGKEAVRQPGASMMFAKNADGSIDAQTQSALDAVKTIPVVSSVKEITRTEINQKYIAYRSKGDAASMSKYDNAVKQIDHNYSSYGDFAIDENASQDKINKVCEALKIQGEPLSCN